MQEHHRLYQKIMHLQHPEENTTCIAEFLDAVIAEALSKKVSDIHCEPQRARMRIRFRIDGMLYTMYELPASVSALIMSNLKVRANLDIAEKRLPQDGRCRFEYGHHHAIARISTFPTLYGEKVVLRIFYNITQALHVDNLGLESHEKNDFLSAIHKPQGLILITGPTGSGKTTTLYTALSMLNSSEKNITCIEDPVEIELEGINQLSINHKIGLHFTTALESLLRQDPDIIVVGEIRNTETATMVIQAAQTGHLVFSTLHTNSALESIDRLSYFGIPHYDLMQSIVMIIAQRLVRKLCVHCRPSRMNAVACPYCVSGYHGQTALYEYTIGSEVVQTLKESAEIKIKRGITNRSEVQRVLGL